LWFTKYYSSVKSEIHREENIVSVLEEVDIQGDPGGNIKFWESDNIVRCEKKIFLGICV